MASITLGVDSIDLGIEYLTNTVAIAANSDGSASCTVPTGKKCTGGGYSLDTSSGVFVRWAYAQEGGFEVYAYNSNAFSVNVTVHAVAIAAS